LKEKIGLILLTFFGFCTANSQIPTEEEWRNMMVFNELRQFAISMYEPKKSTGILSISTESYFIDPVSKDTSKTDERIAYYDGKGNLAFLYSEDHQSENTQHWIKQPDQTYNVYYDGVQVSVFSIQSIDKSHRRIELTQQDTKHPIDIEANSSKIRVQADTTIIESRFDAQGDVTAIVLMDLSGNINTSLNLDILTRDQHANWTSRLIKRLSEGEEITFFQKREIRYADEYTIAELLEIKMDSLEINDELITDPEVLNPDNEDNKLSATDEEGRISQKFAYKAVRKLFYKKYFNDDYFFNFSVNDEEVAETLDERLFKYLRTFVFDRKNKQIYMGRTNSKRWFDKTASFRRMEQMESPPTPTDNWENINGYHCREFVKLNSEGKEETFFVTEDLPFINYIDFTFTLPGFILKSTRYYQDIGKATIVISINQADYPFHFLEFLGELNETFGVEIKYLQQSE
jgi:hypothetical protein